MPDAPTLPPHRGLPSRFFAGARQVPAGLAFLIRRPGLWPLAALPVVLTAFFVTVGVAATLPLLDRVQRAFEASGLPLLFALPLAVAVGIAVVVAGAFLGLVVALLAAGPAVDSLSRRVELHACGTLAASDRGVRWETLQALRGAAYLLVRVPLRLLVGLVPFVGPPLALAWAAHVVALQETDGPLARRGLDFPARRRWHRAHRPESLGFGAASLLFVLVPGLVLLFLPVLTTAAARLVVAVEGQAPAGEAARLRRHVASER